MKETENNKTNNKTKRQRYPEPIAPRDPHEALYFAIMRKAAWDYKKALDRGDYKECQKIEDYMSITAGYEVMETICRMIQMGIDPVYTIND